MMATSKEETAKGGASPMAVVAVLRNHPVAKTYPNVEAKAMCVVGEALWLCRLAAVNPLLRDLRPVVIKRWGELLAIGHSMNGGGHVL